MRALIATSILFASVAIAPAHAGPQNYGGSYGAGATIRCESNDGRLRECATGGSQVQLVKQLSNAACLEGRSWGYGRAGVWVSQGCRAEFRTLGYAGGYGQPGNGYGRPGNGYGRPGNGYGNAYGQQSYGNQGNGQLIRCESNDGRTQRCAVDTRGGVQLVRKLSDAACIQGRSWSYDGSGIWVSQGCRADFAASGRGYAIGNTGSSYGYGGQVFRCESNDGRTRECAANTRAGVQLVRVLSNAPCVQGTSWGYGRNGIWVSRGCRAEFRAY